MQNYSQLCITCKKQFDHTTLIYTCPDCGDLIGTLEILYDYDQIKKNFTKVKLKQQQTRTIFRYSPLLPLTLKDPLPTLKIGDTPLYSLADFARKSGLAGVYLKDDSYHPSLSLKDRASVVSLLKARELGFQIASTASTGNAAASLACLSAHMNFRSVIFVPESIPKPKLIQLQIFGAAIVLVRGSYDRAFDICRDFSRRNNFYNRSTGINPFNLEGKKTVAFEICEQLDFSVPDLVFVPVGDGSIISGIWKGFREFYQIGLIDRLPRLIACQAAGSAAIYQAFRGDRKIPAPVEAKTVADSICVNQPRDGLKALQALRQSGGDALRLSDPEILRAQQEIAMRKGIFCEPSAAAAFAGFLKYRQEKKFKADETAVLLFTGSGMKDLAGAEKIDRSAQLYQLDPEKDDPREKLKIMINKLNEPVNLFKNFRGK